MTTFDHDDDVRRDESDELHGHAGGWFDKDAEHRTLAAQGYVDPDELFWAVGLVQVSDNLEAAE